MNFKKTLCSIFAPVALAFGVAGCDGQASEHGHCTIDDSREYAVQVVSNKDGGVIHEGGRGRFEIDDETCTYRTNAGDKHVYLRIPPAHP